MKKLILMILIAITTSITVSSCTDEEIAPSAYDNGGGAGSDPKP